MPLLYLQQVTKRYAPDQPPAVDSLTLTVEQGEILALLGPSGCGKTTTLRLIAGFESPDAGLVKIRGETMAGPDRWVPPEERGVGIVFQDYALFPHLTVEANVAFGLHHLGRAAQRRRVAQVLELVGLEPFGRRYPHELSGGQQQRVAVARALAPAPALILLDEPFSNLDADLRAQMREEVERILRNTGTTTIFVTHDQEEAFTLANRVGILNGGRLEQLDPPEEIYHHPASQFVAEFVGAADFLHGHVTAEGIVTELGVFANIEGRGIGENVEVMIRPDDITFTPWTNGEAVIIHRYFRGSENLYCLRLPSDQRVHSSQPSTAVYPMGTRVRAEAHVIHVVTFPRRILGGGRCPPSEPPPMGLRGQSPRSNKSSA
jgi:iron(III) transport system ATP-binding protein